MKKQLISFILVLAMVVAVLPAFSLDVWAGLPSNVSYIDENGMTKQTSGTPNPVNNSATAWGTAGSTTWWYVSSNTTISNTVTVSGNVNLILKDGVTLTVSAIEDTSKAGINVTSPNSLTIFGQENSTGKLIATGADETYGGGAGIGGNAKEEGCNIEINGGEIIAIGGEGAAGIGGGAEGVGINITIGGIKTSVSAVGCAGGAGIGGGSGSSSQSIFGDGQRITISNGSVRAEGGDGASAIGGGCDGDGKDIVINGGTVSAIGGAGASGIGGGMCSDISTPRGEGSRITINGGFVEAEGGASFVEYGGGAGIGGGFWCTGAGIEIKGGSVKALGGYHASGIGGGQCGSCSLVTISAFSSLAAIGGTSAAGIGGGPGYDDGEGNTMSGGAVSNIHIEIENGTVSAIAGSDDADGIGKGWDGSATSIFAITTTKILASANTSGANAAEVCSTRAEGADLTTAPHASNFLKPYILITAASTPKYTVNFTYSGSGNLTHTKVENIASGTNMTVIDNVITIGTTNVIATANDGYTFSTWSGIEGSNITKNITITAIFVANPQPEPQHNDTPTYVPTYRVSIQNSIGGTARVSNSSAAEGSTVIVTITPNKGFDFEELIVKTESGNNVTLYTLSSKTLQYHFVMPGEEVVVSASYADDNTMLNYFVDVKATDYYYDAVLWAAKAEITSGTDNLHFDPLAITDRAQMVTFLWRLAGCPVVNYAMTFKDIDEDAYYAEAVRWGAAEGYILGTSETTFSPNTKVTRAEALTFLWRYNGSLAFANMTATGPAPSPYGDVNTSAFYYNAVLWAKGQEITSGVSATSFAPNQKCTRADVVTFMYRSEH